MCGQVAAGCWFSSVLGMVRSSPSSCFTKWKQLQLKLGWNYSGPNIHKYRALTLRHFLTLQRTDGPCSQLQLFSDRDFGRGVFLWDFPKSVTLHKANLYNEQHRKTHLPVWAPGEVRQQPGWVTRKTARTQKSSWIVCLKENTIRFLGKTGS